MPLTRKAADLLRCLLARPGALVSHQEILRGVWPDTHVQPENVKALVHELRSALGDHSHDPVFIRSETGRGYTFVADVTSAMVPFLGRDNGPEDQLFVNREEELALIDRRLETATNTCEPQLVVLESERGVGKTSLCQAVVRMARRRPGLRITYGQCPEVSGPVESYGVLIDALDLLARQHPVVVPAAFARRAPDWLARFPHWREAEERRLPPTGTSAGEELLMRDLAGVLDELAADMPSSSFSRICSGATRPPSSGSARSCDAVDPRACASSSPIARRGGCRLSMRSSAWSGACGRSRGAKPCGSTR